MKKNKHISIFSLLLFTLTILFPSILLESTSADDVALTIVGTQIDSFSMDDLIAIDLIQGYGGYLKTTGTIVGPYEYKGVPVLSILSHLGYPLDNYSIELISSDGYNLTYDQNLVEGKVLTFNLTGHSLGIGQLTFCLGYEEIGESSLHGGPLRAMFLSNDSEVLSDGPLWSKEVIMMRVLSPVANWSLSVNGLSSGIIPPD